MPRKDEINKKKSNIQGSPAGRKGGRKKSEKKILSVPLAPLKPEDIQPISVPEPEIKSSGPEHVPLGEVTEAEARNLHDLAFELLQRKFEALRLYTPLNLGEQFHACRKKIRLIRGSNRSGKTLHTMAEVARAVTGRDPHEKYPQKDGRCYIVARDEKQLGEVVYVKLFKPGAFRMIRDLQTGEWRVYRPWEKSDLDRKKEARPAPALIPRRYIKSISWRNKKANVPEKVVLTTGWTIDFFSSNGKPPRGMDLDLVVFDEEILDGDWLPEMLARLLDRQGLFIWDATPQAGTDRLYELWLRCERELEEFRTGRGPEPSAVEFFMRLDDNPYFSKEEKAEFAKNFTEEEYEVRIEGNFALASAKVYPEWSAQLHLVDNCDFDWEWSLYAITDPGRQVCAVMFLAVPPPSISNRIFMFDELYIRNCDAREYGVQMAYKCRDLDFMAFYIDMQGARTRDIGSGKSIIDQYQDELAKNQVESRYTGSGFRPVSTDVKARTEAARSLLKTRPDDPEQMPKLAVVRDRCPNFEHEIKRYRYKKDSKGIHDVPEDRGRVHQMANFGYAAAANLTWIAPPSVPSKISGTMAILAAKRQKRLAREGATSVNLGPARRSS